MSTGEGLTVRRTERQEIALPCELSVAPAHAMRVNFTAKIASADSKIEATVVDASCGGLGVMCPAYFPKGALVELSFANRESSRNRAVESLFRVQRIVMADRSPRYLLGLAYADIDSESADRMAEYVASFDGASDA